MKKNTIRTVILGTILSLSLPCQVFAANVGDAIYSTGNVNIRSNPDMESDLVGGMGYNAQCIILEGPNEYNWIKIQSGDVVGYVANQYFSDTPLESGYTLAQVNAEILFVRQNKDVSSDTISALAYGDVIEVTSDYDGSAWVNVVTSDGNYGCVNADYVSLYTYYPTAQPVSYTSDYQEYDEDLDCYQYSEEENYYYDDYVICEEDNNYYSYDDYVICEEDNNYYSYDDYNYIEEDNYYDDYNYIEESYDYYEQPIYEDYSLNDYYYDESNTVEDDTDYYEETTTDISYIPSNNYSGVAGTANQYLGSSYVWGGSSPGGFDCSGLAQYSYAQNGISIPRTAADQYYGGNKISVEEAVNTPGALIFYHDLGHVAISNGDGTVTHASNYNTGVITSDAYYSTPYGAVVY